MISREDRGRRQNERQTEKYEAMDCIKSIFLWYYTAPLCSRAEQRLLSVSCTNVCVMRPSVPCLFSTNSIHANQTDALHQDDMYNFDLSSWFDSIN